MKKSFIITIACTLFCYQSVVARSCLRPKNIQEPQLIAKWAHEETQHVLNNSHIEEYPLFVVYNEDHFNKHLLPSTEITYRYDVNKTVSGLVLNKLIEELVQEIKACKRTFTHFVMLQNKDFSHKKAAGLIVLRFKDYPFVLKLFIETPESFVNPWCKGTQPVWFFYMGGGVNRHITGLTRIKNMELIRSKIQEHPLWSTFIDLPRKWFWQPKNQEWIILIGKNLGEKKQLNTCIPSIYAIIADQIIPADQENDCWQRRHELALELCNGFDMFIDPHIDNFLIEEGTNKFVIIDTEHFPTLVGFKKKCSFHSYAQWYYELSKKATHDIYFRLKSERKAAQFERSELNLFTYV